jgi:Spy/CpxP family protein refolding chaperone
MRVFLVAAVLVLCAGVVVGRLSMQLAATAPPPPPGHPPSWLADQLDLTADQRQQMDAIWADVKQQIGSGWDKRHDLDHERDQAIQNLLTDQQKTAYQKIYDDYRSKRQEIDKTRDALIKSAEERSRALLNDSQQKRWDLLAKDMHGHHPGPGPDHHPDHDHGFAPTSKWSGGRAGDHGDHGGDQGPPDQGPGPGGPGGIEPHQ